MKLQSHYQQNHTQLLDTIYTVTFTFEYIEINLINNSEVGTPISLASDQKSSPKHTLPIIIPMMNQSIMHMAGGALSIRVGLVGFFSFSGFSMQARGIIKPNHTNPLVGDLDCQFEPKPLGAFGPHLCSLVTIRIILGK